MVKAIFSNPLTRKVVASTMFATAVVGANATNLKTENNDNLINQTEVMSKDAASIYKVRVEEVKLRHFQHNEKLDKINESVNDNRPIYEWEHYPYRKEYMLGSVEDKERAYVLSEDKMSTVLWNNLIIWPEL